MANQQAGNTAGPGGSDDGRRATVAPDAGLAARQTVLSRDRCYRYALWRQWADGPYALFIGLNPSTADETVDDPTIRRCVGFARSWGYGALCMVNLFAFRATQPAVLKQAADPVGPDNDAFLRLAVAGAGIAVAAWGNHGAWRARSAALASWSFPLQALALTASGEPGHPLYLPATAQPFAWNPSP